jgi:hypothetical protein
MKLRMGLLNVLTVADSSENAVNPRAGEDGRSCETVRTMDERISPSLKAHIGHQVFQQPLFYGGSLRGSDLIHSSPR